VGDGTLTTMPSRAVFVGFVFVALLNNVACHNELSTDDGDTAHSFIPGEQTYKTRCLEPSSLLAQYAARHRDAVEYLKTQHLEVSSDGSPHNVDRPRFLVWRCRNKSHMGGIGDRIKRFGGLFVTAIATGRVLLLDFPDFSDIFEPRDFEWRFDELRHLLADHAPKWWEFQGESEQDDAIAQNGRHFANMSLVVGTETRPPLDPRTLDFDDDVSDFHRPVMYFLMTMQSQVLGCE